MILSRRIVPGGMKISADLQNVVKSWILRAITRSNLRANFLSKIDFDWNVNFLQGKKKE